MQKTLNDIVGTWELMSWMSIDEEGEKSFPFGEDAKGYLFYSPEGIMSLHLSQTQRELFKSHSVLSITPEEALQSYNSYTSYCGRYEVKGDKILHHVQLHRTPNWVKTIQERDFKLEDDTLYLSHTLENMRQQLVWKKLMA